LSYQMASLSLSLSLSHFPRSAIIFLEISMFIGDLNLL
jgi:hypothetical protein